MKICIIRFSWTGILQSREVVGVLIAFGIILTFRKAILTPLFWVILNLHPYPHPLILHPSAVISTSSQKYAGGIIFTRNALYTNLYRYISSFPKSHPILLEPVMDN